MSAQPAAVPREALVPYACPVCCASLVGDGLVCIACERRYDVSEGVPLLVAGSTGHAAEQAAFFDEAVDEEFEVERPAGTPRLYGWLLEEKVRRAVGDALLAGRTVLVVCGGSGMDAEFLARRGAHVVSSDISLGAAKRTRLRARRHRVEIEAVVADVEHLPFADRSFDVVYVHDGLHHLESPLAGLAEMARVARETVVVTEPAQAQATAVAVRLGLAVDVEEAGNRVERLRQQELETALAAAGYVAVRTRRYAMVYRHEPGRALAIGSLPLLFPLARAVLRAVFAISGSFGNKLALRAERER